MKKIVGVFLFVLLLCTTVYGAGTSTLTSITDGTDRSKTVLVSWVADAADHTVPDLNLIGFDGMWLCSVITNPGTTAPTDDYDIYLKYDGADILGGGRGKQGYYKHGSNLSHCGCQHDTTGMCASTGNARIFLGKQLGKLGNRNGENHIQETVRRVRVGI